MPRVSGSSPSKLEEDEEDGVFHLDPETLMMYVGGCSVAPDSSMLLGPARSLES